MSSGNKKQLLMIPGPVTHALGEGKSPGETRRKVKAAVIKFASRTRVDGMDSSPKSPVKRCADTHRFSDWG